MSKHKRRKDYWKVYHMAHAIEVLFLIDAIAEPARKYPCPWPHTARGRHPKHSKVKLAFAF